MELRRTWKDGRQLVMLFPDGTFHAHIYCGFHGNRAGQQLEFEGKTYKFAGYY